MAKFLGHEKETEQQLILKTDIDEAISSESDSGHEDSTIAGCDSNTSGI
jgi:hypothetical protein